MAPLPADRRAIDLDRGGVDGVPVTAQDRGKLVHREIRGLPPNEQDIAGDRPVSVFARDGFDRFAAESHPQSLPQSICNGTIKPQPRK